MKTKQHFIISVYERKFFSNRGGSKYILQLYENLGKGNLKRIGIGKEHQTASHKGEISEGYTDLKSLNAIKPAILKAIAKAQAESNDNSGIYNHYYYGSFNEKFGLQIDFI